MWEREREESRIRRDIGEERACGRDVIMQDNRNCIAIVVLYNRHIEYGDMHTS